MPVFVDDPLQLSKARLKSDLIAHNVELPSTKSKKEVYVELHMRHVDQKNAADFSSDEEPEQEADEEEVEDANVLDPHTLTDDGLKAALLKHGVTAGPIVASTRAVYEKKLRNLLLSNGHNKVNRADEAVLYSDSENEEEDEDNEESVTDTDELKTTADTADQAKSQDPAQECFKDLLPDNATPTGIYATRRRPIKGAAGRPVQYLYPETPVSPTALERREVECRLVPLHIQISVFVTVAVALYLIYVCVEDLSLNPLLSLLAILNQQLDTDDPDKQDAPDFLELEY